MQKSTGSGILDRAIAKLFGLLNVLFLRHQCLVSSVTIAFKALLGISRWAGIGGSYRTMLRFFHTVIPWATLFW
ncbi:MAG: hypothetical protein V7K56_35675, partial [Nostoc sp.]